MSNKNYLETIKDRVTKKDIKQMEQHEEIKKQSKDL